MTEPNTMWLHGMSRWIAVVTNICVVKVGYFFLGGRAVGDTCSLQECRGHGNDSVVIVTNFSRDDGGCLDSLRREPAWVLATELAKDVKECEKAG